MATPRANVIKLTRAINYGFGAHIVVNTKMFHSEKDGRVVKLYNVADSYIADGKFQSEPLFQTSSVFFTVIFLRNVLFALQGKDIPDDNDSYRRSKGYKTQLQAIQYVVDRYGHTGQDNQD